MTWYLENEKFQYVIKNWVKFTNIELANKLHVSPKTINTYASFIRSQGIKLQKKNENRKPIFERFWEKVEKTDTCWLWTGARTVPGYGKIGEGGDKGNTLLAHRVSWEMVNGKVPEDLFVCHKCDNPPCVRPSHLFLGTPKDNMSDKVLKGRNLSGERSPNARLTEEIVSAIRDEYTNGGVTQYQLAEKYGVCQTQIHRILAGKRWAASHSTLANNV